VKHIIILLILFSCSAPKNKNHEKELAILYLLNSQGIYDSVECQKSYALNPVYTSGGYAQRFSVDTKQYSTVAITDSTWDISRSFAGFYNPETTQMNSVAGDTLCDYNSRFTRSVKTTNPSTILVSTLGGNDFLKGYDDSLIIATFKDFYTRLKSRFSNSNFVFVQVHPTKLTQVNDRNARISPQLKSNSTAVCWVDPASCFSSPVLDSEFLPGDSIHYSQGSATCIKSKIKSVCGVEY